MKIKIADIIVEPNRGRKDFGQLQPLADSIQKVGLINPITVTNLDGGKYKLIAGERRYRACMMILCRAEIDACLFEDLSPQAQKEIELEENLKRKNLDWPEEAALLSQITHLMQTQDPKWGLRDTAAKTERSLGNVATKIALHQRLLHRPDLKERVQHLPYGAAAKELDRIEEAERTGRLAADGYITLSTDLRCGDCRDLIKTLTDASVDLLLTDPPYGLEKVTDLGESSSSSMLGASLMSEHHNQTIEKVKGLLSHLAPQFGRVLKPGAHFYMFCGFQYIGVFIDCLSPFLVFQPPVVIWDRGKPSTPGYGYNYMSRAEAVIYGYKPPRSRRLNNTTYNILTHPEPPRNLRIYPTEKPVTLLEELIQNSTNHNDLVLDPFAGSASTLVAARRLGRRAIGFEINNESFLRAQSRLRTEGLPT